MEARNPPVRLCETERKAVLEKVYGNLVALLSAYCPGVNENRINTHLRNIDFSVLDDEERTILGEMLPELTVAISMETDEEGNPRKFTDDVIDAEIEAGGWDQSGNNKEEAPFSEEYLRSQVALLRANSLYASRICGIDSGKILLNQMYYHIATDIFETGHPIPSEFIPHLTEEDKQTLNSFYAIQERESEKINLIKEAIGKFEIPTCFPANDSGENRGSIRDTILEASNREKAFKLAHYRLIKRFLEKHSDLSSLALWLLGF